jgi:hypothetical protein
MPPAPVLYTLVVALHIRVRNLVLGFPLAWVGAQTRDAHMQSIQQILEQRWDAVGVDLRMVNDIDPYSHRDHGGAAARRERQLSSLNQNRRNGG